VFNENYHSDNMYKPIWSQLNLICLSMKYVKNHPYPSGTKSPHFKAKCFSSEDTLQIQKMCNMPIYKQESYKHNNLKPKTSLTIAIQLHHQSWTPTSKTSHWKRIKITFVWIRGLPIIQINSYNNEIAFLEFLNFFNSILNPIISGLIIVPSSLIKTKNVS